MKVKEATYRCSIDDMKFSGIFPSHMGVEDIRNAFELKMLKYYRKQGNDIADVHYEIKRMRRGNIFLRLQISSPFELQTIFVQKEGVDY